MARLDLSRFQGMTAGPWTYSGTGGLVGGADRRRVADCNGLERRSEERQANCRAIAALPDLLAEVARLRAATEELMRRVRALRERRSASREA